MVLRKMLDKFRSKVSEEPDKSNSSKEKKLKKVRSIRVAPKKTSHLPLSKPPQQSTAEVPNYMKSTTSYDARKEKNKVTIDSSTPPPPPPPTTTTTSIPLSSAARALVKNSSLKLLMSSMKKNRGKNLQASACSSTIMDLNEHHDALALKACHYTYCSLHGHKHGAVPSLKRLFSARRQSLKVQKSMKMRGYSSIKKKGEKEIELVEDVVNELFIEIHSKLQEWGEERSRDDAEIKNIISRMNETKLEDPNEVTHLQESFSVTSFEDCGDKNSELPMEDIQVINQFLEFIEKGCQEENQLETEKSENEHLQSIVVLPHSLQGSVEEASCGEQQKDISEANLDKFAVENNVKDSSSLANRPKVKYSKLRRQKTKLRKSVKEFNLQPPRLLALQVEPEQEQVNLKHQTVDERKAAEEWMIDYALRKALRRLSSVRKRKVPQLVAAFETVMPQMCETGQQ